MPKPIRTKIVATLGPASATPDKLRLLADAGADVFRINFSHGINEERDGILDAIRAVERDTGRPLGILADLCGPKIRVGEMVQGGAMLGAGEALVVQREPVVGNAERINTTLPELIDQAEPGQSILLDDGKLLLTVAETGCAERIVCRVERGGLLTSGKGVNLPHTRLTIPVLTEKDLADIAWLVKRDFDYIALSFVREPGDIEALRARLAQAGRPDLPIMAKIEKPQALAAIEEIVATADAVMVARGDLGVEMDLPSVPVAQKTVARQCARLAKPCVIATQMLESMIASPTPTRAEVSDVANAVLDHADAVMLSGETAVGRFPVESVAAMNATVEAIQAWHDREAPAFDIRPSCVTPAIATLADSVRAMVERDAAAAIVVFSLTGRTARILSKHRPACPILGLSPDAAAMRRMTLYYGVESRQTPLIASLQEVLDTAAQTATELALAKPGDTLAVVAGQPFGVASLTNTLVLHTIPETRPSSSSQMSHRWIQ